MIFESASNDKTLLEYEEEIDGFKLNEKNLSNPTYAGGSTVSNSNAHTMVKEILINEQFQHHRRIKVEQDLIAWLNARTIGVQYHKSYSSRLRLDAEARRNAVIDDLEDAFFSG